MFTKLADTNKAHEARSGAETPEGAPATHRAMEAP
jgi:hypothetical protein